MDSLGKKIQLLLDNKGLKQKDLAQRLGIKPSSVNQWVKGTSRPDQNRLAQIAEELDVTVDELLGVNLPKSVNEENTNDIIQSSEDIGLSERERLMYELKIKELELEMERRVNAVQAELLVYKEKEIKQQQQEIERQRSLRPDQDAINK